MSVFPRLLATTSAKKKAEWEAITRALMGGEGIKFQILSSKVEFVELESLDPTKVCLTKALHARHKLGMRAMVENAFFQIRALGGFPGPLYASVEKTVTNAGLCKLMYDVKDRHVVGGVSVGFTDEAGVTIYIATATIEGEMPVAPQGPDTFGWDNLIIPKDQSQSYAEMGLDAKNLISPRRKAIEMLLAGNWQSFPASDSIL